MPDRASIFSLSSINPIVRLFIVSDFFIVGGLGLVSPIFALFVTDFIEGATIEVVGIAMTIYLVTRSIGQLPVGIVIDRICGQRDDMLILIFSSLGFAGISISYIFIDTVLQLYLVQFVFGLLGAASYPTWSAIFTRAIDEGKEGFEWSMYQTIADLGAALTAAIGSFIAEAYGFTIVFILMAIFSLMGSMLLIWSGKILLGEKPKEGRKIVGAPRKRDTAGGGL